MKKNIYTSYSEFSKKNSLHNISVENLNLENFSAEMTVIDDEYEGFLYLYFDLGNEVSAVDLYYCLGRVDYNLSKLNKIQQDSDEVLIFVNNFNFIRNNIISFIDLLKED